MKKTAALVIVSSVLFGTAEAKEDLMIDVFVLDTIEVTGEGERKTEVLDRTSTVVAERNRSNNIADFLVNDSEIAINRRSNFGDSGDIITIRGMDSKRIQLNMDGRDISSTGVVGGNFLDFGTIPLDNIERIEVIKGGSAIEYGNTALGGVINAYSRKPTETPYLSLYSTLGGWSDVYDFHNIRGSYTQKLGPLGLSLGLSHQKSDAFLWNNDFELFHSNPKLYLDTPWEGGELALSYNYSRAKRGLTMSNRGYGNSQQDGDITTPGWDTPVNPNYPLASGESFAGGTQTPASYIVGEGAHWIKERHLLDLGYRQEVGETGFYELMAYSSYETRREKNFANNAARDQHKNERQQDRFDFALTPDGALVMDKLVNVDRSFGYKLKTGFDHDDHKIKFGSDYMIRRTGGQDVYFVDKNYNSNGNNPTPWAGGMTGSEKGLPTYILGAYIGDQYRINDLFTSDIGLRYDGYDARSRLASGRHKSYKDGGLSPKAMLTWTIDDNQAASLALYRNLRAPAANEYGWFTGAADPSTEGTKLAKVYGTDLKMEDSYGADLAYKHTFDSKGYAKVSAWYYDVKDYINMRSGLAQSECVPGLSCGGTRRTSYNLNAQLYGLTLSGQYPLTDDFSLHAGLTRQDSKKSDDIFDPQGLMDSLEYVSDWKGNLGCSWLIVEGLNLDTSLLYVGKRNYFFLEGNKNKVGALPSYVTLGASLSYKLNRQTTMEIYADNITDANYEERWGYPAMGFNAGVSLKWEL